MVTSSKLKNWLPTNIRRHHTKFSNRTDLAPGFLYPSPLPFTVFQENNTFIYTEYFKAPFYGFCVFLTTQNIPFHTLFLSRRTALLAVAVCACATWPDMTYGCFCSVYLELPIIVLYRRIMQGLWKYNYQVLYRVVCVCSLNTVTSRSTGMRDCPQSVALCV